MTCMRKMSGLRILALLTCLWSASVFAKDLVLERAYFEDVAGHKTIKDIQEFSWQPYEGVFSRGYSTSAYWIQLKIPGTDQESDTPWILQIKPTFIDEVAIWDAQDLQNPKLLGDRHPWIHNEYLNFNFNVALAKSSEPRYIWLRLKTTSANLMDVQVQEVDGYIQMSRQQTLFYISVVVVLSALFLMALLSYSMRPDRLRAIFVIYQLMAVFYACAYTGFVRAYFHEAIYPPFLDLLTSFAIFNYTFASIYFYCEFLKEYQPQSWCLLYFNLFLGFYPMQLLMLFSGHVDWALKTNALLILITPLFALISLHWGVDWHQQGFSRKFMLSKRLLVSFYVLLILSLWSATLPALNWLSSSDNLPDRLLLHGLITGAILTILMYLRERRVRNFGGGET